jgi:SAM-dependent methyltransferase
VRRNMNGQSQQLELGPEVWAALACPDCGGELAPGAGGVRCAACGTVYPMSGTQPDLRLRSDKHVAVEAVVRPYPRGGIRPPARPRPIPFNSSAKVDIHPEKLAGALLSGNGLTRELASWFPAGDKTGLALDLGSGNGRLRPIFELTGFQYVGLDVEGSEPTVLGLGEALPFKESSIDFVFALAVVAHTTNPFLTCKEIARVLKPGGWFIGTTQFLEACAMNSRHHVTFNGLWDWLDSAGFEILHVEANADWSGIRAILQMGYLPSRFGLARGVAAGVDSLHRWWARRRLMPETTPVGEMAPERFAGGFRFVTRVAASTNST